MNFATLPSETRRHSPSMRRLGIGISALVTLALLADGCAQVLAIPAIVVDAASEIGYPASAALWQGIGAVLLISTILYAIPRTAFFGAILITGFLGGAIASHVRIGQGAVAPVVAALVLATLAWAGLWLRDARVRALVGGR
jgi:hypothetical protein